VGGIPLIKMEAETKAHAFVMRGGQENSEDRVKKEEVFRSSISNCVVCGGLEKLATSHGGKLEEGSRAFRPMIEKSVGRTKNQKMGDYVFHTNDQRGNKKNDPRGCGDARVKSPFAWCTPYADREISKTVKMRFKACGTPAGVGPWGDTVPAAASV